MRIPRFKKGDRLSARALNRLVEEIERNAIVISPGNGMEMSRDAAGTRLRVTNRNAGNAFYCVPSGSISAASAAPASGTPGSLAGQTIYSLSGGAYVALNGTYTVYNGMLDSVTASKVSLVLPNGDGTFSVINQSCT